MTILNEIRNNGLEQYYEYWLDFHQDVSTLEENARDLTEGHLIDEAFIETYHQHEKLAQRISTMREVYGQLPPNRKEMIRSFLWPEMFTDDDDYPIDYAHDEYFIRALKAFLLKTKEALEKDSINEFTFEYLRTYKDADCRKRHLERTKQKYFKSAYSHFSLTGFCNEADERRVLSVETAALHIIQMKQSYLKRIERCMKYKLIWEELCGRLSQQEVIRLIAILNDRSDLEDKEKRLLSLKVRRIYESIMAEQEAAKDLAIISKDSVILEN